MKLSAKEHVAVVRLAFDREVKIPQPEQPPGELRYVIFREAPHYVAQGLNVELSSFGATPEEAAENLREAFCCLYELPRTALAGRKARAVRNVSIPVYAEAV